MPADLSSLSQKRILLIVSGGIAAYKTLELIRRLRENGANVRCILTEGGAQFVTPLSLSALSGNKVYQDLWSLTDETEMGHIRLSREADVLLVAPASADILARHAAGLANDLATTALLATDKPVLVAPAMNVRMWEHPATQDNLRLLRQRGVQVIGPEDGAMACGEFGPGRMSEPHVILQALAEFFSHQSQKGALSGLKALVTSGPTHEPIDPVRFIANRSSGKQGHAIAAALAQQGASVTLVTGPVQLPEPAGVKVIRVETAREMLVACQNALPADIAVCAAAVADWHMEQDVSSKIKKTPGNDGLTLRLAPNPDILATLSQPGPQRPRLVIGFSAETDHVLDHATDKLTRKGCDWIVANDVSRGTETFGGDNNTVHLLQKKTEGKITAESWPSQSKQAVAEQLIHTIISFFKDSQ